MFLRSDYEVSWEHGAHICRSMNDSHMEKSEPETYSLSTNSDCNL